VPEPPRNKRTLVEFRILGPLEAVRGARMVRLGGGRQRALLALLLIHANQVLSTDRLIDELWGGRPPVNAKASLQNMVASLRKAVGTAMLLTISPGYALPLDPGQLDSARFERLRGSGVKEGAAEKRVPIFEEALRLFRGPPLVDVFYESFAQAEIGRLEELRMSVLEDLCAAKLEIQPPAEVVPELQSLVRSHPYRERLRRQLMLALYRSGRGVDALQTYVQWCARLREEWETEPGRAIQQTAKDIRDRRPELGAAI